jgi:glycine/D-amino acid oxidase-like deaminating enzyme
MQYLNGLTSAFLRHGGRLYTQQQITQVQGFDCFAGSYARIHLRGVQDPITSRHLVVTNNDKFLASEWASRCIGTSSYCRYTIGAGIRRKALEDALHWDMTDPQHLVRLHHPGGSTDDILVISGEFQEVDGDHSPHDKAFRGLEDWARRNFPMIGAIRNRWAGKVSCSEDGLPLIGKVVASGKELFISAGNPGINIVHGTLAGLIIADQIAGRSSSWGTLYDPMRSKHRVTSPH